MIGIRRVRPIVDGWGRIPDRTCEDLDGVADSMWVSE